MLIGQDYFVELFNEKEDKPTLIKTSSIIAIVPVEYTREEEEIKTPVLGSGIALNIDYGCNIFVRMSPEEVVEEINKQTVNDYNIANKKLFR